jgi:hypothetical protein
MRVARSKPVIPVIYAPDDFPRGRGTGSISEDTMLLLLILRYFALPLEVFMLKSTHVPTLTLKHELLRLLVSFSASYRHTSKDLVPIYLVFCRGLNSKLLLLMLQPFLHSVLRERLVWCRLSRRSSTLRSVTL